MKVLKIILGLIVVLFFGCNGFSTAENGLEFKVLKRGKGMSLPENGDIVQCHISIITENDSVFYSTFGKTPERLIITDATHKGGDIMDALKMLSEGDSARFLISADSFFLKTRQETVLPMFLKPKTKLSFVIKMDRKLTKTQLDSIVNTEKLERWNLEINEIKSYNIKNGLEMQIDTATGIRYQFHQKQSDTAKRITDGKIITFHFIGKLMNGIEFMNTYTAGHPQSVRVFKEQFKPIGFYEMLIRMKEKEKATFILPYDLAFGARGVEGMIPPFSTLVYEIYIIKVND